MPTAAQSSHEADAGVGWEEDFGWDDGGGGSGNNAGAASRSPAVQDGAEGAPPRSLASPVHRAGRAQQGSGDSWNDW